MTKTLKYTAVILCAAILTLSLYGCFPEGGAPADIGFFVSVENGDSLEMKPGEALTLNVTSYDQNLLFSASSDCVTVSQSGVVTANRVGTATVTVRCGSAVASVEIRVVSSRTVTLTADKYYAVTGDTVTLTASAVPSGGEPVRYVLSGDTEAFRLEGDTLTVLGVGKLTVTAVSGDTESEPIEIFASAPNLRDPESITLSADKTSLLVGESGTLSFVAAPEGCSESITFSVTEGKGVLSLTGNRITALRPGTARIVGQIGSTVSNAITVTVEEDDPYAELSREEFYASYTVATSHSDACLRSEYGFMSGSLTVPDQAPTVSSHRPMQSGKLIKNSEQLYTESGNCYVVVDSYGGEVLRVYRGGAYITLEEVAAYVYAFGEVPANYAPGKNETDDLMRKWGEYLRLNHSRFTGNTSKYPYQPVLPNISGCGGTLQYMELDIGTTGTDCDPSYICRTYNDGDFITRGAARIVYGKSDLNGNGIYERGELHLFYTYNHYNDFFEYLNYYGGWGNIFGNVTGGGTLSSKHDYNPTPYIEVITAPLPSASPAVILAIAWPSADTGRSYRRAACTLAA